MSTRDQPYRIKTPLPEAELWLDSFTCQEGLSQLGRIEATLFSPRADIDANDLLGKTVSFEMALPDDNKRHFHGYITRFGYVGAFGSQHVYQALVRPWLWFLTRTTDCRIFQDMKVPDIVKTVFADHGVATFDLQLFRDYRVWEYCVQYRESDFDFVSRLLEHEGIYYRFEHEDGRHKLILLDSISAHDPQPAGLDRLPFYGSGGDAPPDIDYVSRWTSTQTIRPSKFASADYDFQNPHLQLRVSDGRPRGHDQGEAEVFDFPGGYTKTADGAQYMEDRLDESDSLVDTIHAATNAQNLRVGFSFSLQRHAREDPAAEWIVTQMSFQARNGSSEAGGGGGGFHCDFQLQDKRRQFRPQRTTPKPVVQGLQSAVVVGPKGDEIHTDKYGRIRVKFHWDRAEHRDERSSCWVRVAQQWAGKNFGAMFIPRIGHEVLVSFLEGDPDQPIVTGCVYNGDNMPPWGLPANATQSGWLTRSSKNGSYGNANMIRFEDKKGAEALELHAEKNMSTSVENDQSLSVGHDQTNIVRNHQKTNVLHGREVYVEADGETYYVKGKRLVYIDGDQEQAVTKSYKTYVTEKREEYTTGDRISYTQGKYIHKSTEAYFDVGPLFFMKGTDFMLKASAAIKVEAAADQNYKAANFKWSATGDFNFTGNKFNRTIFEGNDTVLGANTNTYIGSSRDTAMGPAVETYVGMKNSIAAGIAVEGFMGMQVSNCLALTVSNAAALAIENAAINMGMTGVDLGFAGLSLENNGIKLLNGGMASGPGAAVAPSGAAGLTAVAAAAAGLGFGVTFGALNAIDAKSQADKDVNDLLNNPDLTPEVRARLQQVMNRRVRIQSPEDYSRTIPEQQIAAQTAALAQATPGATPPTDPTNGLAAPPMPANPAPASGH